jgi:hypothetical protein
LARQTGDFEIENLSLLLSLMTRTETAPETKIDIHVIAVIWKQPYREK